MSIVIPSYNGREVIEQCLLAVFSQVTAYAFEVIVSDSSNDGTASFVAERFPDAILLCSRTRLLVGEARQAGVRVAGGEIILFTDVDCVPSATWLQSICDAMRACSADGVGGSLRNGTRSSLTGSAGFYLEFFRFLASGRKAHPSYFLVGGNSGFRRDVLAKTKYSSFSAGEDMLMNWTLVQQGSRLFFAPQASVLHRNRTGFGNVSRYQMTLGEGACAYRSVISPQIVRVIRMAPLLIFLAPVVALPWICWTILCRGKIVDLLHYLLLTPICFVLHLYWCFGFYRAVRGTPQSRNQEHNALAL